MGTENVGAYVYKLVQPKSKGSPRTEVDEAYVIRKGDLAAVTINKHIFTIREHEGQVKMADLNGRLPRNYELICHFGSSTLNKDRSHGEITSDIPNKQFEIRPRGKRSKGDILVVSTFSLKR
ncbi:MAG: hypothetical protein ACHQUA_02245 [Microgenomates group bacterium]